MKLTKCKKNCGCVDCLRKFVKKNTCDCTLINTIVKTYKKLLLRQLKFKIRNRGRYEGKMVYSREFKDDEWITFNESAYHLIRCRTCKQLSRATLFNRWTCVSCIDKKRSKDAIYAEWDVWGD